MFEQKFYGLFEHMSLAFSLKASEAGSIVCTIAGGKCALFSATKPPKAKTRRQQSVFLLLHAVYVFCGNALGQHYK